MKLSVLLPVDAEGHFLDQSIKSVLDQDYSDFELLIVGSCSSDRFKEIVEQFAETDERIRIVGQSPQQDQVSIINAGLKAAKGDYIVLQGASDLSMQGRFKKQLRFMEENKDCVAIGGGVRYIKPNDSLIGHVYPPLLPSDIYQQLFVGKVSLRESLMFRKTTLLQFKKGEVWQNEHSLHAKLLKQGEIYSLPELVYTRRLDSNRATMASVGLPYPELNSLIAHLWSQEMPLAYSPSELKKRYGYYRDVPVCGRELAEDFLATNARLAIKLIRYKKITRSIKLAASLLFMGMAGYSALRCRLNIVLGRRTVVSK